MTKIAIGICTLFISIGLLAQKDSIKVVQLEPVDLKVTRIEERNLRLPIALTRLNFENSQDLHKQLSLNEYLIEIPGLFAMNANNFSQDLRVSLRGFGARSAFGIRGIKLLVDGIPETTPDGQGQIDNLNLAIIKEIEVIRGPASSLYGNASGGVISINTLEDIERDFVKVGLTLGTYHMNQAHATMGLKKEKAVYIFQGNRTSTRGYRQQSGFENYNFNLKANLKTSEKSKLILQTNYTDSPYAEDPGGLTLEEVESDRMQARQRNIDFRTEEKLTQFKIGGSYQHDLGKAVLNTYGFYANRDFFGLLPFEFGGIVDLQRNYFGHGSSLSFKKGRENSVNEFQFGYDLAFQYDSRSRFLNLQGTQGAMTLDQQEIFNSIGFYALDHYKAGKFLISAGIRYDRNLLQVRDNFLADGDDDGKTILNSFNPSIGLNFSLSNGNALYTSFSTSFETPTLSELSANPSGQGGFNEDLKSQNAQNYELGYKHESKLNEASLAIFYIMTKNDLVPYEIEAFPGRTFFRNAGSTNRKGLEFTFSQAVFKQLIINAQYTYSDFSYDAYTIPGGDFKGKQLPGIPEHMASISFNYQVKKGPQISLLARSIGSLYANDANAVKDKAYTVANLNFSYDLLYKKARISTVFGLNNLFDKKYNDNIRINAFGSRYYEPAPGFNIYGGLKISL